MEDQRIDILQSIFKRVLRAPPDLLFHYTTIEGLLGIIESKSLWASQIQYLNDSLEFNLMLNIAQENLKHPSDLKISPLHQSLLGEMANALAWAKGLQVCVCSFSERGDLLSQWRGYSSPGPGFSIGFKSEKIEYLAHKNGFYPTPCVYTPSIQDQIVKDIINNTLHLFDESGLFNGSIPAIPNKEQSDFILSLMPKFVTNLAVCAPMFKHYSFSEEKEWRLITNLLDTRDPNYKHRKGLSLITPYYKFKLTDDDGKLDISKIIVGPTPHRDLSRNSVISLLNSNNVIGCEVENSSVPFRNW